MELTRERSRWWWGNCYHLEQLENITKSVEVQAFAWILHDKDINSETGEPKKPHYHFLVELYSRQRGSWFKQFWTDDLGRVFPEAVRSPKACFGYLTHSDEKSEKLGKYRYSDSEVTSTFEDIADEDAPPEDSAEQAAADLLAVASGAMSWVAFYKKFPKRLYSATQFNAAYKLLSGEMYGGSAERVKRKPVQSEMDMPPKPNTPPPKGRRKLTAAEIKAIKPIDDDGLGF
jgi:hypothetical protein